MLPLLLMALAVVVLAGALAVLARRERPAGGAHLPDSDSDPSAAAREVLAREVRSLADDLAETDPATATTPASPMPPEPAPAAAVSSSTTPSPEAAAAVPRSAPVTGWDPTPTAVGAAPQPAVAYAALAEDLLAESRSVESAVARWAADLHLLRGRLVGHEDDVVRALGPDAAPDRRQVPRAPVALDAVARGRYRLRAALGPELLDATLLPALPDPATLPPSPEPPDPVLHEPREALLERADLGVARARTLVLSDPVAARRLAWESDLAAFDVVLLDSAERAGDRRLVSVRLRRQLALRLLAAERDPQALAATLPDDVTPAVRRVRALLSACLEVHERPALRAVLGAWDDGPASPGRTDAPRTTGTGRAA